METVNLSDIDFDNRSRDEKFMLKVQSIVDTNLDNEHFSVKELAGTMALSRIQLYRRLRKITGKNVSQFIREYRLERAMDLLKKDVATVSEIAYRVGFGSPAYFNKCFHRYFGYPPGEVIRKRTESFEDESETHANYQYTRPKEKFSSRLQGVFQRTNLWILLSFVIGLSALVLVLWFVPSVNQMKDFLSEGSDDIVIQSKSIAVLPLRNESPDPENEYLCNGMQDEILNHLQKIADLSVRSRTSVEQYRTSQKTIPQIGREINAANILEGSLWREENQLRMSFQLIETSTDEHLWGESYEVLYSDTIFKIQTYIARRVAESLEAVLSADDRQWVDKSYSINIESYDLSIRGVQELENFFKYQDQKHVGNALIKFNQALIIDPENVKALVGKANVWRIKGFEDSVLIYCNKAISIDSDYHFSYQVKAAYFYDIAEWDLALENYLRTIELSPNNALAHSRLGELYLISKRDVINGLTHLNKSLELNILSQPYVFYWVGMCYIHVGEYEKAKTYFMKMVELENNCDGIQMYSWSLIVQQKHSEAFVFLDSACMKADCKAICLREKWYHSLFSQDFENAEKYIQKFWAEGYQLQMHWEIELAWMYMQLGRQTQVQSILDTCKTHYENSILKWGETWYNTFNLSKIYILSGETKKGLRYLEKAAEIGMLGGWQDLLEVDRAYEILWDDREFRQIIEKAKEDRSQLRKKIREIESGDLLGADT